MASFFPACPGAGGASLSREVSEALVLWGVDFSETSRIYTLLTPTRGRIACIAKGVRRKNSPLASVLDSMNHVEVVYAWKEGRQVQTLTEAALLHGFETLKADFERAAYAAFPVEIATKVARENDPAPLLFQTLLDGLHGLEAWAGSIPAQVLWQAIRLLTVEGYAPALDTCCHCGEALVEAAGFRYDGGATCLRCPADRRLAPERWKQLKTMAREACPAELDYNQELFHLIRHYAARQLDCEFRSVRVLNELFPQ